MIFGLATIKFFCWAQILVTFLQLVFTCTTIPSFTLVYYLPFTCFFMDLLDYEKAGSFKGGGVGVFHTSLASDEKIKF